MEVEVGVCAAAGVSGAVEDGADVGGSVVVGRSVVVGCSVVVVGDSVVVGRSVVVGVAALVRPAWRDTDLGSADSEWPGRLAARQDASMTDDTAISYQAAAPGTPVLSSTGTQIGTLERVLDVPELDVFDGIVIATRAGLRFVDADYVERITRSYIRCSLTDSQAGQLPPPKGPPVYRVDAFEGSGQSIREILGRLFRRRRGRRGRRGG